MSRKFDTSKLSEIRYSGEDVFHSLSESDVYLKYLGYTPQKGKRYKSPFSEDTNPSFYFYVKDGKWLWKDFSSGKGGDCIGIVAELHNCNYYQAIQIIGSQLDVKKVDLTTINKSKKKTKEEYLQSPSAIIDVVIDEWNDEYLDYWKQYGLELSDLVNDTTDVRPCKEVWLGDKIYYSKAIDKDICFRYKVFDKYKIYRPYAKKKECKWLSNTKNYYLQNFGNIEKYGNKLLIITKSMKDALCLTKLGYNAVSFGSESAIRVDEPMKWMKKKFKRIVLFYDNDAPGKRYSAELAERYKLEEIFIPNLDDDIKDISDWIKYSSLEEAAKFMKNVL